LTVLPVDLTMCELGLGDLATILELVSRCDRTYVEWAPQGWEPPDLELDRARWANDWNQPDHWARGAAERSGRLVGLARWRADRDDSGRAVQGAAHVSALFIHPDRWREGIAEALLVVAEAAMREQGYRVARLWTPEGAPAQGFYEATGWSKDGRSGWHEGLRLPIVGYEKRLASRD
jgi:GNAT superfamily N-acetyltransferase